jgi:hypothetical protein
MSPSHTECSFVHDLTSAIVLRSGHLVTRDVYQFVIDLQSAGVRVTPAGIDAREARISPDGTPDAIAAEREVYRQMRLVLAEPPAEVEH